MQALEEKHSSSGNEGGDDLEEGKGATPTPSSISEELETSETEMIEFFKSFKKELYRKQHDEHVRKQHNPEDEITGQEDLDIDRLLDTHGRARANSTFQTVKYIGRWMRAVDRKAIRPEAELVIPEEDSEEDEDDYGEEEEEEMIRFFRSLKLDDESNALVRRQSEAENVLDKSVRKSGNSQNEDDIIDESEQQKEIERKATVLNTVKFVVKWMEKVEANTKKTC